MISARLQFEKHRIDGSLNLTVRHLVSPIFQNIIKAIANL